MELRERPIGVFDSGVGGISVLKQAIKILPNENFIYFGDSIKAPYGTKTSGEVKTLTFNAVDFLIKKNIKALVIACNTATSVAIADLREKYSKYMPIIGIEPALKPAAQYSKNGKIVIMATPITLSENKFENLMKKYEKDDDIELMPCPGLVELIESGVTDGEDVMNYLKEKFYHLENVEISVVVLGCTHYPFIKNSLKKVLLKMDKNPTIIDGSTGTANQLKRQLIAYDINAKPTCKKGTVNIYNSLNTDSIIKLSKKLLDS